MTRARPEALIDLLLASAPLRGATDVRKRAPLFEETWRAALQGELEVPGKVSSEAAKDLLKIALGLCEAAGISGPDLTNLYNARRDAGVFANPADLETLLATAASELLAMMAGPSAKETA
jgi:hypothetical protein